MNRKPSILDAMILVAATAVGIAWTRATVAALWEFLPMGTGPWSRPIVSHLIWWPPAFVPGLMSASLGVFLVGVRRREVVRDLIGQPGVSACAIAVVVLLLHGVLILAAMGLTRVPGMTVGGEPGELPNWYVLARGMTDIGLAVLAAGLASLWAGTRGRAPAWIEWPGRIVGAGWIVLLCVAKATPYLIGA